MLRNLRKRKKENGDKTVVPLPVLAMDIEKQKEATSIKSPNFGENVQTYGTKPNKNSFSQHLTKNKSKNG